MNMQADRSDWCGGQSFTPESPGQRSSFMGQYKPPAEERVAVSCAALRHKPGPRRYIPEEHKALKRAAILGVAPGTRVGEKRLRYIPRAAKITIDPEHQYV